MQARLRLLPEFIGVVVFGFVLYLIMSAVQDRLELSPSLFSFETWLERAPDSALYRFFWLIGDTTEPTFYASLLGGFGLLAFALLAHLLYRAGSGWRGIPISYGTGLWPWIFIASLIGLGLSVVLFGGLLSGGWVPTFVPFVSVPAAVVFVYGAGWKNALTGAILGALVTFPIAYLIIQYVLAPLGLPGVIGAVTGMWLGAIIVFEICRYLPWMSLEGAPPEGGHIPETREGTDLPEPPPPVDPNRRGWFGRRVLADFSEAQFYGNEWASAGLLLGTLLSWVLNPLHPALGTGLLPAVILSQVLTSAVGVFLYYERWRDLQWYPTFVPLVSVAPAMALAFGGTMQSILLGAVLGAIVAPPVAQFVIDRLPDHWHLFIGNTFSMALCSLVVFLILRYLLGFEVPPPS